MKITNLFFAFTLAAVSVFAQSGIPSARSGQTYGETITTNNALKIDEVVRKLNKNKPYEGKIEGEVLEVCKKKGCFIKVKQAKGEPITVKFKDYGFFMPQDIVGKTIVMEGTTSVKEVSVARLKHDAKDAGKSQAEIDKITKPKRAVNIIANGVVVI